MVGYAELAKMNTFTMNDVFDMVGNIKTASSLVLRLSKKGLVKKIRNNLYTCINITDNSSIATKFHIACGINETAYISYHSAFEYMGMTNQVFYEVYVSSLKYFTNFEYDGIIYKYIHSKNDTGVISPKNTEGIRVTTLERTIVDSIKDYEKIGGLEELLNCISNSLYIDENQLKVFLDVYDIQFLYQKTGFLLKHYSKQFNLSNNFINYCKSKIGNSTRYLTANSMRYINEWKLVVPGDIFQITEQGGMPLV